MTQLAMFSEYPIYRVRRRRRRKKPNQCLIEYGKVLEAQIEEEKKIVQQQRINKSLKK